MIAEVANFVFAAAAAELDCRKLWVTQLPLLRRSFSLTVDKTVALVAATVLHLQRALRYVTFDLPECTCRRNVKL